MFITVYRNNLLFFGANIDLCRCDLILNFYDRFCVRDLCDISHYLKINVNVDLNIKTIGLKQSTYLKKTLSKYSMSNCKPAKILINFRVANCLLAYKNQANKSIVVWYQFVLKAFIWPAIHTCPELAYSIRVVSRFYKNHGPAHMELVKLVL